MTAKFEIPNYMQMKIADENGHPTPEFHNYMMLLNQVLQGAFSNEGFKLPQQTTDNIALLNTAQSKGAFLYDKESDEVKVNINGTFKTVQVA